MTNPQADLTERARALVDAAMSEAENLARDVGASQYGGIPHFVIAYGRLRTVIEGVVTAALQSASEAAEKEMKMNAEQQNLLLTVARILRAQTRHSIDAWAREDYAALNEALKPFDATPSEPINEELR